MSLVAVRYAEALFSLAEERNAVFSYKEQIDLIKETFEDVDGLKAFFMSARISKEAKKEVIVSSFEKNCDRMVINFLCLLIDKNRITLYEDIFKEFHHMCNENLHIREGVVESPRPLSKEDIRALEDKLGSENETVELHNRINRTLISGFRITLDNQVIDASMKEKIARMSEALLRKDNNLWN